MKHRFDKTAVAVVIGVILVLIGLWQLARRLFGTLFSAFWHAVNFVLGLLWPLAIIAIGVILVVAAARGKLNFPKGKQLFRSQHSKKIAGVCGGIAEYLGVDPVFVRVAAIVLAILCVYVIVPLYLLLWIIVPKDDSHTYNTWA
jgi:phage shock protein C